jgi:hypothetical protein
MTRNGAPSGVSSTSKTRTTLRLLSLHSARPSRSKA